MLTSTINAMLARLAATWDGIQPAYEQLLEWSRLHANLGWLAALVIVWILAFMLMSYCCFKCEANTKAGILLFMAVIVVCLASACLALYGILTLAIGGNTSVFLCSALYDGGLEDVDDGSSNRKVFAGNYNHNYLEEFEMFSKLFDKPGYVYATETQTGIIGELLRPAGVNRSIVNVTLREALR